jgi:hypothetical protein
VRALYDLADVILVINLDRVDDEANPDPHNFGMRPTAFGRG